MLRFNFRFIVDKSMARLGHAADRSGSDSPSKWTRNWIRWRYCRWNRTSSHLNTFDTLHLYRGTCPCRETAFRLLSLPKKRRRFVDSVSQQNYPERFRERERRTVLKQNESRLYSRHRRNFHQRFPLRVKQGGRIREETRSIAETSAATRHS